MHPIHKCGQVDVETEWRCTQKLFPFFLYLDLVLRLRVVQEGCCASQLDSVKGPRAERPPGVLHYYHVKMCTSQTVVLCAVVVAVYLAPHIIGCVAESCNLTR